MDSVNGEQDEGQRWKICMRLGLGVELTLSILDLLEMPNQCRHT